jgi:hypothetical protein
MQKILKKFIVLLGCLLSLSACGDGTTSWQEQVKLLDGRVIVVTQKRLLQQGQLTRDAWLTINLPEFSSKPIEWHEALEPLVLNVFAGRLYLVTIPSTKREFVRYGSPLPTYIGYVWNDGVWRRINFSEIPQEIYDTNMLVTWTPQDLHGLMLLARKNSRELNGSDLIHRDLKRINPSTNLGQNG